MFILKLFNSFSEHMFLCDVLWRSVFATQFFRPTDSFNEYKTIMLIIAAYVPTGMSSMSWHCPPRMTRILSGLTCIAHPSPFPLTANE